VTKIKNVKTFYIYGKTDQIQKQVEIHQTVALTTMFPLRLCVGKLLVAVTRQPRYGPSRLRVNDDDDDDFA